MNKHLIAAAAATALTFASIGAPAQADIDRDNVARAIFGVAAVAIIAGAISSGSNQPTVVYHTAPPPQPYHPPQQPTRALMPGHCAHVYSTSTGPRRLLNADCLTQHYALAGRLPLSCAVTVRVAGGFESGFDPTCLRNVGYRAHRY